MSVRSRSLFRAAAPALPLLAGILVLIPHSAESDQIDRVTRALQIPLTTPLAVRATVGEISVTGWDRPQVEIEIVRRAPDAKQLTAFAADVDGDERQAQVTVLQTGGGKDPRLTSSIVVRVPTGQALGDIELFEGRLSLQNLSGGVRAHVEHGSIDAVSLAGRIRLETGIGAIRLERAELSEDGMIRLRTFNGDVTLGFPSPPAHARILAVSLGGLIESDLPLTLRTTFGPRFGELTLGRGSPAVSIDVVRGNIRITTRRS